MTSVLERAADALAEKASPPYLKKIRDWRDSSCIDPKRYPSQEIAPNWDGPGTLCRSCATCRPEQRMPAGDWDTWLYLAGRGCVAPWTRIYLPTEQRWERIDVLAAAGRPVEVLALGTEGPATVRTDGAPFLKGTADYWTVTLEDGRAITVTDHHRFLTPQGWRRLADVHVGQLLGAPAPAVPGSDSSCPSGSPTGDPRWTETPAGSPVGCRMDRHCGGPQLPWAVRVGQGTAPPPGDAFGRSLSPWPAGGRGTWPGCSPPDPPSSRHARTGSAAAALSPAGAPPRDRSCAGARSPQTRPTGRPCPGWTSPDRAKPGADRPAGEWFDGTTCAPAAARSSSSPAGSRRLRPAAGPQSGATRPPGLTDPSGLRPPGSAATEIRYPSLDVTEWARVVSIRHAGSGPYYDMTVPGAASYLAEGIWNHNSGKTRSAAEVVAETLVMNRRWRIAVLAPTYADGRDTCIEGESGLISIFDRWGWREGREYVWNRSLGELIVRATRSRIKLYSAEKPARLRGPQHHMAWVDELAQVVKDAPDAWDMLLFGLRLGRHPRVICTTTPLPVQVIKDLLADETCTVTRGTTDDNAANLAPVVLRKLHRKYDGTRLGRQELGAELLDDIPGALWRRAWLDDGRIPTDLVARWHEWTAERTQPVAAAILAELEERGIVLHRIVVAVDPAVTSGEGDEEPGAMATKKGKNRSDESGIVVAGRADDGHFYVLADYTIRDTPDAVMAKVIQAVDDWGANGVIVETNNGGDYIPGMLRMSCRITGHPSISIEKVHAKKSKRVRAEPVSAIYGQGQAHHVGTHHHLEDQICIWSADLVESPDRMDALVYAILHLDVLGLGSEVMAPSGARGRLPRHQMRRHVPTGSRRYR